MTEPGGGGDRLEVGVVADATGFARDAQAKIDAAVARVRAKIRADIDLRRLQAQTEAAAKRVQQTTRIQLQVGIDRRYFAEQLRAAVVEANRAGHTVKVKVDVDQSTLGRIGAGAGGDATVNVDGDVTELQRDIDEVRQEVERRPIDVPVQIDNQATRRNTGRGIRAITGQMSGLQKFGFYAGLVQTLASAATAAGGGLYAMAGAASQALGTLAAAPNIIGIAAQGIGALLAGFSGISGAVGAMAKVQTQAGKTASSSAKTQAAAQRRIADARRAVADAAEQGDRRIVNAEKGVADAQKATERAQKALTQARKDAQKQLRDYALQLSGAALDEEDATLRIEEARDAWNKAMRNPASTALDRKEADLALRQAEQSLKEIQQRNSDLREEASAAETAGVEGSTQVVAAKQDVVDATDGEAQAQQDLVDAHKSAARDISDAQQNLADALDSATEAMGAQNAAATLLDQAMAKLSPAGREFARFISEEVKPRLIDFRNAIQQELLPGVQAGIKALMTDPDPGKGMGSYLDVLQDGLKESGRIMGDTAKRGGELMSSPAFREDTGKIMSSNNRAMQSFADAGLALVNVLRHVAVAAGPMVERFATFIKMKAETLSAFTDTADGADRMQAFFRKASDRAAQLGRIAANLVKTLVNIGSAGSASGESLLTKLDHLTTKWATWTKTTQGQDRIKKFFDDLQPAVEKLGGLIAKVTQVIVTMGENGGGSLNGMLWAVNALLDGLQWLLSSPVGPFLSTLLAFSSAATVFSLVGGKVFGLVGTLTSGVKAASDFARGLAGGTAAADAIGTSAAAAGTKLQGLASNAGTLISAGWSKIKDAAVWMADLGKAALVTTGRVIAQSAAWVAQKVAMIASKVAVAAYTVVQWALNVAMDANPIGVIIMLIGLLVAAFIWAWNNIDGFADFFKDIFGAIGDFFEGVWNGIKSVFSGFIDWIVGVWDGLWNGIKSVATSIWNGIKSGFDSFTGAIAKAFQWVKDTITGIWNGLWGGIKSVAQGIWDFLVGAFNGVRDSVIGAFNWIKDKVGAVWDSIKNALATPIRAIVDVVYNNGIRKVYNWINNLWGGDDWPELKFARGGTVPGYAPGKDRVPAMLSPGEGILVPEAVRGLGGPQAIQAINSQYSSRVNGGRKVNTGMPAGDDPDQTPAFAGGGWLGNAWNSVTGFVGDAWDKASDLIAQGWKIAVNAAADPVRGTIRSLIPEGGVAGGFRSGMLQSIDKLVAFVGGKEDTDKTGGQGKTGSGWEWIYSTVKKAIPQARVNSSVRNTPDAHGRGKAVDLGFGTGPGGAGSQGLASIAKFLYKNFGHSLYELIYDGVGDTTPDVKSGKDHTYNAATRQQHANHVHAAVYDRGGRFPTGSAGVNTSGRDEGVLTADGIAALGGWARLNALNAGVPLADLVGTAAVGTRDAVAGDRIGTYISEGAIQVTTHNPVPESASDTLNRTLRRAADLGIFATTPGGS